ncbi:MULTISPECIES: aldolase/citrate lyase family protein [unclassified Variovorax]|jgi:4-hydroxy-2-oxoheptanedioate aldolase|uniref:aldolase/citrate lyase family protein n=1 Tax=unclassified Variovorax TaxID=663243 RepID=UPI00086A98F0|nr:MULTISPECIES: aldolase/citrate lyase family protein [unclassified Variovorax]MBN8758479.1 2-dehydro-3-deoxyglucarate aldolase [Variovorax sp.]ODU18864.1 MAG: 2-dehydro-3-deoxyglucarate aldolase [Variovorax sp. SCN 67-85]ODV18305.1 MAG: 2-dehydro-3-deoxyglucarate aldolase [Variovorax sp. SCN 67-20]OJZ05846.1 MAG: 2-dehydro-3-deoxyglucarate aldolase [Variovorax sp. 67-131]
MEMQVNRFKAQIAAQQAQIGLWLSLGNPYSAEICAGAGFDWVLIDGEHTPNDLQTILAQLQALAAYPDTHPIARLPMGHGHVGEMLIKQYLDIGVQTLLIPMVETPEHAAAIVRAARYPQDGGGGGIRGMAGARASRWGRIASYAKEANNEVCLLLQAESRTALENLDYIASTEGVDGIFIGPADLSASLGHVGDPGHPDVQAAIADAFLRVTKAGKAVGILAPGEATARQYLAMGATFVAVGLDTNLLVRATSELVAKFKHAERGLGVSSTY